MINFSSQKNKLHLNLIGIWSHCSGAKSVIRLTVEIRPANAFARHLDQLRRDDLKNHNREFILGLHVVHSDRSSQSSRFSPETLRKKGIYFCVELSKQFLT